MPNGGSGLYRITTRAVRKRKPTYLANFCPLLFGGEFSKHGSDFGEAIYQSVKRTNGGVGFVDRGNSRSFGRRQKMPGLGANSAKLALQIVLSELGVEHGHFR